MCNNIIILYIFMFIKLAAIFIIPIIILVKRKTHISKILIIVDIILLSLLLIGNAFKTSSCVYNSTINGINRVKKENQIKLYSNIHSGTDINYNLGDISPSKYYKTFIGSQFYYYNQNDKGIGQRKITCEGNDYYMNKYGSSITSISMAISTLLNRNISPIEILELYTSNITKCPDETNINDIFKIVIENYGPLYISDISGYDVPQMVKEGAIVIAKINGNRKSTLSCGESYIVIYNITLEEKLIIADPNDSEYPYVCSTSSSSYGNVLKGNRTNSEWSFDELNSQVEKYYLIKRL